VAEEEEEAAVEECFRNFSWMSGNCDAILVNFSCDFLTNASLVSNWFQTNKDEQCHNRIPKKSD
jgi:hypothetical protein